MVERLAKVLEVSTTYFYALDDLLVEFTLRLDSNSVSCFGR